MTIFADEIKGLQHAQAIDGIEFKMLKRSGDTTWDERFTCVIPGGVKDMHDYDRTQLAQELNEAIAPVLAKYRNKYIGKVKRAVAPYQRDDEQ